MDNDRTKNILKLIGSIAACEGAGGIGSVFTTPAITTWYATLEKPTFTPPDAVFLPIWLTLYLLMGIAVFLIWRQGLKDKQVKTAFILFWVQLVVNILWSVFFFGFESPLSGVIVIGLLWVLILFTILRFFKISRVAGALLIPYIVWTSIAASLNVWILILN
jgi:tryptophan-rich sensory protein